jgi:ankyrin repeat protein
LERHASCCGSVQKSNRPSPTHSRRFVISITGDHKEAARLLIANGADINRAAEKGRTPLMYAAAADFGDPEMIDLLLNAGARAEAKDDEGLTAADYPRKYNRSGLGEAAFERR